MKMFKKLAAAALAAALAVTALVGCGEVAPTPVQPEPEKARAVFADLNAYREEKGLNTLELDESEAVSEKMIDYAAAEAEYFDAATAYANNQESAALKKKYDAAKENSMVKLAELRKVLPDDTDVNSIISINGMAYDAFGFKTYFNEKHPEYSSAVTKTGTKAAITSVKVGSTEAIVIYVY